MMIKYFYLNLCIIENILETIYFKNVFYVNKKYQLNINEC